MTHYLVLGAGLQGTAAVHDLLERGDARSITWLERDATRLAVAKARVEILCARALARAGFTGLDCRAADVSNPDVLRAPMGAADVCLNCLPYRFALDVTRAALDGGTHLLDLGGNTAVAEQQLALHAKHPHGERLCVLPDCGLMPGMGNLFTALAVARMGDLDRVALRCGGLPRDPKPPLDYMLLFSVEGLTNEYFGHAEILRGGRRVSVPTFSELEEIDVPGLGRLEAFITSGGLSTAPRTFEGRIQHLDYKTLRYRGHHGKFKLLLDLGLLDETPVRVGDQDVVPRQLLHVLLQRELAHPGDRDVAVLMLTAQTKAGARLSIHVEDHFDETTGFTAMERTTAYSATACAHLVARGEVKLGPGPLESVIDPETFLVALRARGIRADVVEEPAPRAGSRGVKA